MARTKRYQIWALSRVFGTFNPTTDGPIQCLVTRVPAPCRPRVIRLHKARGRQLNLCAFREFVARQIYGTDPDAIIAGGINPTGKAFVADGGYTVSGQWGFGSGIRHATWVYRNCVIHQGEQPRLNRPSSKYAFFASAATFALVIGVGQGHMWAGY